MDAYLAIASRRDERRYRPTRCPTTSSSADPRCGPALRLGVEPPAVDVRRSRRRRARLERIAATVFEPGNIHGAGLVVAIVVQGQGAGALRRRPRGAEHAARRLERGRRRPARTASVTPTGVHAALELADDEEVAIVLSFGLPEKPRDVAARSAAEWSARANRKPLEPSSSADCD